MIVGPMPRLHAVLLAFLGLYGASATLRELVTAALAARRS